MDRDQLEAVLRKYDTLLDEMGQGTHRVTSNPTTPNHLPHARWMCQQAIGFITVGLVMNKQVEKVNRWLGFIQGVLWTTGVRTIDQMRADNTSAQPERSSEQG